VIVMPSCGRLTDSPGERRPAAQRLVGGYGQVETLAKAVRVDPEQLSGRIEDGTAEEPGSSGRVLQAAGDAQAAGAEGPVDTETDPNVTRSPRPPGWPGRRRASRWRRCAGPRQRRNLTGVDLDDGEVAVDVVSGDIPSAVRPSAKVTVTDCRARCALVSTCPAPSTMPDPMPHRCPMPTTEERPPASRVMLA
jgi:hypothetical protein